MVSETLQGSSFPNTLLAMGKERGKKKRKEETQVRMGHPLTWRCRCYTVTPEEKLPGTTSIAGRSQPPPRMRLAPQAEAA